MTQNSPQHLSPKNAWNELLTQDDRDGIAAAEGMLTADDIQSEREREFQYLKEELGIDPVRPIHALGTLLALVDTRNVLTQFVKHAPDTEQQSASDRAKEYVTDHIMETGLLFKPLLQSDPSDTQHMDADYDYALEWMDLITSITHKFIALGSSAPKTFKLILNARPHQEYDPSLMSTEAGQSRVFCYLARSVALMQETANNATESDGIEEYFEGDIKAPEQVIRAAGYVLMCAMREYLHPDITDKILTDTKKELEK